MKSGEELRELFTSPNALFIGVCEGRVKSEEYLAKFSAATFCCMILLLDTAAKYCCYTLSQHSINLVSECDCKSTQFPRRFQLFPTIPLRFSCKRGKKKSQRGKEWGKRRTPEEKRRITEKILRNQRKYHHLYFQNIRSQKIFVLLQGIYNHISFMPRQINEDIKEIIKLKNIIYDRY